MNAAPFGNSPLLLAAAVVVGNSSSGWGRQLLAAARRSYENPDYWLEGNALADRIAGEVLESVDLEPEIVEPASNGESGGDGGDSGSSSAPDYTW